MTHIYPGLETAHEPIQNSVATLDLLNHTFLLSGMLLLFTKNMKTEWVNNQSWVHSQGSI